VSSSLQGLDLEARKTLQGLGLEAHQSLQEGLVPCAASIQLARHGFEF